MTERERPAVASRKGATKHTAKSKAAGRANLAKGRAAKREQIARARAAGQPTAGERWAMLLDGTLTVEDLDDDEVARGRIRGADGGFGGRRQPMPSHLVAQFQREHLKRVNQKFRNGVEAAAQLLVDIVEDPDVKMEVRVKAADMLINRVFGKAPETIRIEGADKFMEAVHDSTVGLNRDIPDDASGLSSAADREGK